MDRHIEPQPYPPLNLPLGKNTVRVRAINTTCNEACSASFLVEPPIPGHDILNLSTLCFLIDHPDKNKRILFDAGARKDWWNGSPTTKRMIGLFAVGMQTSNGVDEILEQGGVSTESIDAVIWSHWHWDHVGDGSKFPAKTDIVVGPGFTESFTPGWPKNPDSVMLESDLAGHHIDEIAFSEDLKIGDFRAHDYFGDGSFYILDVPGHTVGHICGLARTTAESFVFMGGDCSHFTGMYRPTAFAPMPDPIPDGQLDAFYPPACPCSAFIKHHPKHSDAVDSDRVTRTQPFYRVSTDKDSAYTFADAAQRSVISLQAFDADPNVLVCPAHDRALFDKLPHFNDAPDTDINDWKQKGYKAETLWRFLNELPKDGKAGRPPIEDAVRRDGKPVKLTNDLTFIEAEM